MVCCQATRRKKSGADKVSLNICKIFVNIVEGPNAVRASLNEVHQETMIKPGLMLAMRS